MKGRNLSSITKKEIDKVIKIVNLKKTFNSNMVKKVTEEEVFLEYTSYPLIKMKITPEEVFSALGPEYKYSGTDNSFKAAQYLIDKGFRFNYDD